MITQTCSPALDKFTVCLYPSCKQCMQKGFDFINLCSAIFAYKSIRSPSQRRMQRTRASFNSKFETTRHLWWLYSHLEMWKSSFIWRLSSYCVHLYAKKYVKCNKPCILTVQSNSLRIYSLIPTVYHTGS